VSSREASNTLTSVHAWRFPCHDARRTARGEAAELNRLLLDLAVAMRRAGSLLRQSSVDDPMYLAADAKVWKILARMNELMNGNHYDADGKR
jgi:hypothetical protein